MYELMHIMYICSVSDNSGDKSTEPPCQKRVGECVCKKIVDLASLLCSILCVVLFQERIQKVMKRTKAVGVSQEPGMRMYCTASNSTAIEHNLLSLSLKCTVSQTLGMILCQVIIIMCFFIFSWCSTGQGGCW